MKVSSGSFRESAMKWQWKWKFPWKLPRNSIYFRWLLRTSTNFRVLPQHFRLFLEAATASMQAASAEVRERFRGNFHCHIYGPSKEFSTTNLHGSFHQFRGSFHLFHSRFQHFHILNNFHASFYHFHEIDQIRAVENFQFLMGLVAFADRCFLWKI